MVNKDLPLQQGLGQSHSNLQLRIKAVERFPEEDQMV